MCDISVKDNIKAFTRYLDDVQKKQVPFATARALTWTAQDSQKAIQAHIPKVFATTRKWWDQKQPTGIRITPAKKDSLTALVYTEAYFAGLQEEGGIKVSYKGKGLLIPTDKTPKYGRQAGGASRVLSGGKVLRKGGRTNGSPIMTLQSGKRGIFRRKGKKKYPIELLYTYRETADIKPRFGFKVTAHQAAVNVFKEKFDRSLAAALKTAR